MLGTKFPSPAILNNITGHGKRFRPVLGRLLKEANVTIAKKHSKLALDPHLLTPEVTILSSWGLKNRSWDRPITAQYPPIVNYLLHICYFPPKKTYTVRLNSYVLHNTHQLLHNTHQL
jgi:hypothetical protein